MVHWFHLLLLLGGVGWCWVVMGDDHGCDDHEHNILLRRETLVLLFITQDGDSMQFSCTSVAQLLNPLLCGSVNDTNACCYAVLVVLLDAVTISRVVDGDTIMCRGVYSYSEGYIFKLFKYKECA